MSSALSQLIAFLLVYVLYTIPLFVIALKSEHPYAWLAWIPFADLWLMCDMADLELWWILVAVLLPGIGAVIFQITVWMRLAENTNKPAWLGILMVLPFVNLAVGYYIAFVDTGGFVA